jgi:hypothetical protein
MALVRIGESLREVGRSFETDMFVFLFLFMFNTHRQLTAVGSLFPRQLTAEGIFVFYMCFSAKPNMSTSIFFLKPAYYALK